MAAAGSSRPCSGACHEISHAIDALYPGKAAHGEQVAVGALFASFLREDDAPRTPSTPACAGTAWRGCPPTSACAMTSSPPPSPWPRRPARTASRSSSTSTSTSARSRDASASSSVPSIAELRPVVQPDAHLGRSGEEHWAGRLYMRRLSPHVTRAARRHAAERERGHVPDDPRRPARRPRAQPPRLAAALGAVLLIQLQLLLDCCDGEVARWRRDVLAQGHLPRPLGHYVTEAALAQRRSVVRADGGWDSLGGWTALGLLVAVLVAAAEGRDAPRLVTRA